MKYNKDKTKRIMFSTKKLFLHLALLYAVMWCMFGVAVLTPYEDSTPMRGIDPDRLGLGIEMFRLFFGYNAVLALLYCRKSRVFSLVYMLLCTICLMRLSWLLTL